jgi:hypothetical protein
MVMVAVIVGVESERFELEIRLLGHLLREQLADLGVVMLVPLAVVMVEVRAAASVVGTVVVRLIVTVVMERAGVRVSAGGLSGQEEQQDGEAAH